MLLCLNLLKDGARRTKIIDWGFLKPVSAAPLLHIRKDGARKTKFVMGDTCGLSGLLLTSTSGKIGRARLN
jgi:hypothetical protein